MHVAKIVLHNWLPYRGVEEIRFKPTVYGVVAEHERDARRSNWLGKTSLLAAIRFALYGEHPADREDDWITRGQTEGGVYMQLDDGFTIDRTRKLGDSTQLRVVPQKGKPECTGKAAQDLIERWVGLGDKDFTATCFFEQKRMARFILARPAERMQDVAAWLRLGPLQTAEKKTRDKLNSLVDREGKLVARHQVTTEMLDRLLSGEGLSREAKTDDVLAELRSKEVQANDASVKAAAVVARLEQDHARAAEARQFMQRAREFDELSTAIERASKSATAQVESARIAAIRKQAEERAADVRVARGEADQKRRLATGTFDGVCPVASVQCPATRQINSMRSENEEAARQAEAKYMAARAAHDSITKKRDAVEQQAREDRAKQERLEAMCEQLARLRPAKERAEREKGVLVDVAVLDVDLRQAAVDAAVDAAARVKEAARTRAEAERLFAELGRLDKETLELRREVTTYREALAILGRQGAQKRLAEEVLAQIEVGANEVLSEAGIDLSVRIVWGRETQGLASSCSACAHPFPSSTRVRVCTRCGTDRGPKIDERLDVELSNRSGAAEDLAGIALSLSASAWLRAERGAGWGVLCVDEPFGSLDGANRHALAGRFAQLLTWSGGGFEQVFVIAHDEGVMSALPGRVSIVGDGMTSRVRVG